MIGWVALAAAISLVVVGPVLGQRLTEQFGVVAGSSKGFQPQTVNFREQVWSQQYLPAIAKRPLTGYGEQLPASISWPYPESQYIAILIEGGYPMLIMYLVLLWGMFDRSRHAARSPDPFDQALGHPQPAALGHHLALPVQRRLPSGAVVPLRAGRPGQDPARDPHPGPGGRRRRAHDRAAGPGRVTLPEDSGRGGRDGRDTQVGHARRTVDGFLEPSESDHGADTVGPHERRRQARA
jgi:hypothetical protein